MSASRVPKLNTLCKITLQAVVYEVWKERNSRLYSGPSKPAALIIKDIQKLIRTRLASLDKPKQASLRPATQHDLSYLSTWFGYFQY